MQKEQTHDENGQPDRQAKIARGHLKKSIQETDQYQEEENRPRRIEIEGHIARSHRHIGVGRSDREKETQKGSDPKTAQG